MTPKLVDAHMSPLAISPRELGNFERVSIEQDDGKIKLVINETKVLILTPKGAKQLVASLMEVI